MASNKQMRDMSKSLAKALGVKDEEDEEDLLKKPPIVRLATEPRPS